MSPAATALANDIYSNDIPIDVDLSQLEQIGEEDIIIEVDPGQIVEEIPCDDATSINIINEALARLEVMTEADIQREIEAAREAAGGPPPKKNLPPPLPVPKGTVGGPPPKKMFDLPAAEERIFRPKFLYMARCKCCGWPGPDAGVELFPAHNGGEAVALAKKLHDEAWSSFDPLIKCPNTPSVKYISSEDEDF